MIASQDAEAMDELAYMVKPLNCSQITGADARVCPYVLVG